MIGNAPKAARGHHCRLLLVRHRQGWPRDRVHDQCNGGEEDVHLAPEELSDRRIGGDRQLLRLVDHVVGDSTQELHCSHGGHHTLVGADFRWPRNHCRRSQRRSWSAAAKKSHRRWDCDDTPTEDKTVMASSAGQCGSSDRYCNCGGSGHTPPHGALIAGVLLVVFGAPGALIGAIAGHWWSCGDRVHCALSESRRRDGVAAEPIPQCGRAARAPWLPVASFVQTSADLIGALSLPRRPPVRHRTGPVGPAVPPMMADWRCRPGLLFAKTTRHRGLGVRRWGLGPLRTPHRHGRDGRPPLTGP